jgi:hypothetical protein
MAAEELSEPQPTTQPPASDDIRSVAERYQLVVARSGRGHYTAAERAEARGIGVLVQRMAGYGEHLMRSSSN